MDYSAYTSDSMLASGKASAYKSSLIKNIEVIGQRKLVIIGGDEDYNILMKTIDQLRKKNVRVPEIAFRATIAQNRADEEKNIRFFDSLKGKASAFYVLILAPHSPVEMQLAAMAKVMGTSAGIAEALKAQCGYTERDFCQLNEPSGISMSMGNMKAGNALNGDAKKSGGMESKTAQQLSSYKDKAKGQRCIILGQYGAKLDELNILMNEKTFAANDFCDFFSRTPLRPTYFLLSDTNSYLGNGKYIEGMECFINGDVKVFEDKFKKAPTYLNPLGNGLINGLPTFQTAAQQSYETAVILPLYEMLQLALYMGYSEIFIYGFDGLFEHEIDRNGIGRTVEEGKVSGFPEKAKQILERVKAYADGNKIRIVSMCRTAGLSMFEQLKYEEIDFSSASIFSKI